jgi:tetratricopeptide (TPR) repeat protein
MPKRSRKSIDVLGTEVGGVYIPDDPAEALPAIEGHLAMMHAVEDRPSLQRLRAMHSLRVAARSDPHAAYNLANLFFEIRDVPIAKHRRKRTAVFVSLFEHAISLGIERLRDAREPFDRAPRAERDIRDIVSRALTNIGAHLSNSGHPDRAVEYFRRATHLFPRNANAQVCLGNMGVWFSDRTGVAPIDGIAAWEAAAGTGEDFCHESGNGCPCRNRFTALARQIERDYGLEHAERWVRANLSNPDRQKPADRFGPVAKSPQDAQRLGASWSPAATKMADIVERVFEPFRSDPVEIRVTLASSTLGSPCRLATSGGVGDPELMKMAIHLTNGIEPLDPFLGDREWRYIGPPETDYLLEPKVLARLEPAIRAVVSGVLDIDGLEMADALLGLLFHIDTGFRNGIASMAAPMVMRRNPGILIFVPATMVGSPPRH